ncbi:MAG: thioesterase family protein [Steroidobacteraceae bacterium]|jgi:acyl-CoA thioester hydrolase
MAGVKIYDTAVSPQWIDYNGHLRDGYYTVIFSSAVDALMDRVGLDESYRKATGCTLYTLEMHLHFLHEVKQSDALDVQVRILAADRKRIHAALEMYTARFSDPVASCEFMLLHVCQNPEPRAVAFPPEIAAAIEQLRAMSAPLPVAAPGSRAIELRSRP